MQKKNKLTNKVPKSSKTRKAIRNYTPAIFKAIYNKNVRGDELDAYDDKLKKTLNKRRNKRECKNMGGVWVDGRCSKKINKKKK
jgi:hypothetical protein|tara:strand:+ start:336 stop:587 length:252 start_codon:yes stop_codon:yes gene_type:complete